MIIENLKQEFYDAVVGERILVLVALDVDALCACRIIKVLFQQDNVQYTIVPVSGIDNIKESYDEHKEQIKHFLLVNCGGNVDFDILEADEDSTFYIVDSHRPLDLNNVFKEQIKILIKDGDPTIDEIPDPEKVIEYEDEDEEDDENKENENSDSDEDPDQPSSKRLKTSNVSFLEKQVKKKRWVAEREKILDEYYECSYYGSSVSITLYDLAWKLTKDNNDLLWLAIVGLTEQYLFARIDREKYFEDCNGIRDHVVRHNINDEEQSVDCMKIVFEDEMRLFTMKGKKRFHELLADIGLPIVQCKQKFQSMDVELRGNVKVWIQEIAEKYGLDDMTYGSFVAQYGYKTKVCAEDVVCAITALLEYSADQSNYSDLFLLAMDGLIRSNTEILMKGINLAKEQVMSMVTQVRSFIDSHQIVCAGPFLYAQVLETKIKKARSLPFVLAVPSDIEEGMSLLVGVPPISESSLKSFFGAAFKQAGEKTKSRVRHDFFDPTVMEIKTEDRSKFFDNLAALMA